MTQHLSEDDIYRQSSQYRLWSFSPEKLAQTRRKTHDLALERARRYAPQTTGLNSLPETEIPNHCLTEEEELRLVQRYSDQIRTTSDKLGFPANAKATAIQYLKRFYLSNSCLTYPPKEIYKTILFLACKTEATHVTLSEYARRISTDPEVVLAPEYKVMQALRFTLDVRQPYRGLKGVLMELLNLAAGVEGVGIGADGEKRTVGELREEMGTLRAPREEDRTLWKGGKAEKTTEENLSDRVNAAYSAARDVLDAPALLTDVYFLYTPSQILLAAMLLADQSLMDFYLASKLPVSLPERPKILATLRACANVLASYSQAGILSKDERAALEAKLEGCRDPNTRDLVKSLALRRGDGGADGKIDHEKAQKRVAGREKNKKEGEDLFGPAL
ncbi:hypothetical protein MBLNU230_g2184t1 [Neophaeotheca triangularis]